MKFGTWSRGVALFATLFVTWGVWLVVSTSQRLSELGTNVRLLSGLNQVGREVRGLGAAAAGEDRSAQAVAARWRAAWTEFRTAADGIGGSAPAARAVGPFLLRIDSAVQQMEGTRGGDPAAFYGAMNRALEEAEGATRVVRARQAVISEDLTGNWRQLSALALLACALAIGLALGALLYERRVAGEQQRSEQVLRLGREEMLTAHARAEQQLRDGEERYRTLFEDSPVSLWEEDFSAIKRHIDALRDSGVDDIREHFESHPEEVVRCLNMVEIVDVNRKAREFYGVANVEELPARLETLFAKGALEVFREEVIALAEGKTVFEAEIPAVTLAGEPRDVNMTLSLVASARRTWSRVILAFFDVTEQRRLEQRLRDAQKMQAVGQLAGGVAHDFNNLLTVIIGYSHMLLANRAPGDPTRERMAEILRCAERAAELTHQLLAFGRRQVLQPKVLDLNSLVEGMRGTLEQISGERIDFRTVLSPNLAKVLADPGQMELVITNLAVNARDAMPEGGVLTIETADVVLDAGSYGHHEGAYVMLSVADTGHGMRADVKDRIFEPFFTTRPGTGTGTGLGLPMVHGIVEQSGGFVSVASDPGRGACFKVCLPRAEDRTQKAVPAPSQESGFARA